MPNTLAPSRGLFIGYLGPTFTFTSSLADFLKQAGVRVFYKDPATGQIKSYSHGQAINSLPNVEQFKSYQFDNNSSVGITFNDYFVGFGVAPDISHLGGGSTTPPPPSGQENFSTRRLKTSATTTDLLALYYAAGGNKEFVNSSAVITQAHKDTAVTPAFTYVSYPTNSDTTKALRMGALGEYVKIESANLAGAITDFTLQWRGSVQELQNDGSIVSLLKTNGDVAIRISGFNPETPTGQNNITLKVIDNAGTEFTAFGSGASTLNTPVVHTLRLSSTPTKTLTYFQNSTAAATIDVSTIGALTLGNTLMIGAVSGVPWDSTSGRLTTQLVSFYKKALTNSEIATTVTTPFNQLEPIS